VLSSVVDACGKKRSTADTSLLGRFERLEGEEASAFYREHEQEIHAQLQLRSDAANQS